MKNFIISLLIIISFLFSIEISSQQIEKNINIIPKPINLVRNEGFFQLNVLTKIFYEKGTRNIADYLSEMIEPSTGFDLMLKEWDGSVINNSIIISISNSASDFGKEGYTLVVNSNNVMIEAAELNGLFYGAQTLRQLLPVDIESKVKVENVDWEIPCVVVLDKPEFSWRGLNLDCCRHFMTKEFVKRYIDLLAYHKFNVLHWHLTEDQGWRIEIKKYPLLTEKGAWRIYDDGSIYGGFYTQEDIKEVVAYAESRFITVVPEIEMPGHSTAAIACYPEYSCTNGPFEVGTLWGIYYDVYCPGNENTFRFLEDVISEVVELFPGKYIHIGGDEVPKDRWKKCSQCQERIKAEGLKDENELQSYFIKRIEKFVNSKGKTIIGWDEILEGGLPPEATVQSWHGVQGAIDAAKLGHDVIVSPTSHCYYDYPVDVTDMQKVYLFDPVPLELTAEERKHVLGSEGNMWTEYAPQELVDDRLFPRILALAEVVWTYPIERNFEEFRNRVQKHYDRLDVLGVNYGLETKPFEIVKTFDPVLNEFDVKVNQLQKDIDLKIRSYGQELLIDQQLENQFSFKVSTTNLIQLSFQRNNKTVGKNFLHGFTFNSATRKDVKLTYPFSEKYPAGGANALTDGIRGSDSFRGGDKSWQGYQGTDFEAVVDLDTTTSVSKVSVGFFRATSSWVFPPEWVEVSISKDGKEFKIVGKVMNDLLLKDPDWIKKDFSVNVDKQPARFIKIKAKNIGNLPVWHPVDEGKAWLMIDEIIVE